MKICSGIEKRKRWWKIPFKSMGNPFSSGISYQFDLPVDLLTEVFLYLDIKSLFRALAVCHKWQKISNQPRLFYDFHLNDSLLKVSNNLDGFYSFIFKYYRHFRSVSPDVEGKLKAFHLPLDKLISVYIREPSELKLINVDHIIHLRMWLDNDIPLALFPRLKYCEFIGPANKNRKAGGMKSFTHPTLIALSSFYVLENFLLWGLPELKFLNIGIAEDNHWIPSPSVSIDLTIFPKLEIFSASVAYSRFYTAEFTIKCPPQLRLFYFDSPVKPQLIHGKNVKILDLSIHLGFFNFAKGKMTVHLGFNDFTPAGDLNFLEWL